MGNITRPRLLMAAFCLSLCGLGVTAGVSRLAQVAGTIGMIVDDGDAGFSSKNFTVEGKINGAYNNDVAFTLHKNGTNASAQWTFKSLQVGTYELYVTWPPNPKFSTNAKYSYLKHIDGATEITAGIANQTTAPASKTIDGRKWHKIGVVAVTESQTPAVIVRSGTDKDRYTVADAAMALKVDAPTPAPTPTPTPIPTPPTAACGNGTIESGEMCDDGNRKPADGCSSFCHREICGDGVVTPSIGEVCDPSRIPMNTTTAPYIGCDSSCARFLYCGDGIQQPELMEACDDGNAVPNDGCSDKCQIEVAKVACNDGVDNDSDGTTDLNDKGCTNAQDTNEADGLTDLAIMAVHTESQVLPRGDTVHMATSVTNKGPDAATSQFYVAFTVPTGATYVPEKSDDYCTLAGNTVTCPINLMKPNEFRQIVTAFNVTQDATCNAKLPFVVRIPSAPQSDADWKNNEMAAAVAVTCPEEGKVSVYITSPSVAGNPPADFANVKIANGTSIQFKPVRTEVGVASKSYEWKYDGSILSCAPTSDGVSTICKALKEGTSNVSTVTNATMLDGTQRSIESNVIGVTVTPAAVASCTEPAKTGASWQNQAKPTDVDNNGKTDEADLQLVLDKMRKLVAAKAGWVLPARTSADTLYFNVDGSRDAYGVETLGVQDYLLIIAQIRCPVTAPTQPSITLHSATLTCDNGTSRVALAYQTKSVTNALHAVLENGYNPTSKTFLPYATNDTFPVGISGVVAGTPVKLCDGNDYAVCSSFVPVTGVGCTAPVAETGNLYVTLDSVPVRSRQLLGGVLGETVLRLNFRADKEDVDVTSLTFVQDGDTNSIERLELYKEGATTAFATATVAGCDPHQGVNVLCATMQNGQMIVKNGENQDILVRPRIRTDEQGGRSASDVRIMLLPLTGHNSVEARGRTSLNNLAQNDGDAIAEGEIFLGTNVAAQNNSSILGAQSIVTMSKIVSIQNANPDGPEAMMPTGINGIGQFKFTAATNANTLNGLNKVSLHKLAFTVSHANVALNQNNFKIYNKADNSTKSDCRVSGGGAGTMFVECFNLTNLDAELDSGESATFVLEADITNERVSATAQSSVQVSFENFSGPSSVSNSVIWHDKESGSTTQPQHLWIEYPETVVKSTLYKS